MLAVDTKGCRDNACTDKILASSSKHQMDKTLVIGFSVFCVIQAVGIID